MGIQIKEALPLRLSEETCGDSKIDFLHKLPLEIWREILFSIPFHPSLEAIYSTEPLLSVYLPYTSIPHYKLQAMLAYRLELLTLCKMLHPLAEELLYSRIELRGGDQTKCFQEAAMRLLSGNTRQRCGEATTHIWIPTLHPHKTFIDLPTLCPNLRFLLINSRRPIRPVISIKTDGSRFHRLTTLKMPEYCLLTWEDLHTMAVCFPSLTELEILNDDKERDQGYIATRPITFSKLQSLTIFVTSSIPLPFHKLELPSLLYFTLSSQCDYERIHRVDEFMDSFLQTVGQTLVGMAVDTPNSPNGYSHIYNHTLLKLPALQIWGCRIDGRSVQEASFLAGLHNLSHLIMFIPYVSHIISAADHIYAHVKPFTSRSAFPQLDKVTLVFFDTSHQFPLDFSIRVIAAAQTLFPHLVVKGRNAACSTLAVLPP